MSETTPTSDLATGEQSETEAVAGSGKVSRWDRPKPPRDWRWFVGGLGRALIALGLLLFGFVAYQLWGTGIQTAQAQRSLSKDFDRQIAAIGTAPTTSAVTTTTSEPAPTTDPVVSGTTVPAPSTTTTPTLPAAQPVPQQGEAVARLEIPRMNLNRIVVEGATADDLTKGPGHFPETPLPGQLGNAAIAGHRTTHLHPFYDIDKLQPGDEVIVTTLNGRYVYHVTGTVVVTPDDYAQVIPTTDPTKATLTLVSCTPRYSSTNRIVVRSELVVDQSDPLTAAAPAPTADSPTDTTLPVETSISIVIDDTVAAESTTTSTAPSPTTTPASAGPSAPRPEAFTDGWFSDPAGVPQAMLWGALMVAIGYGIHRLSRFARRYWVGFLAGFVPFLIALYFFYENVNRLLPPNL